jgi:hypothetical protein
LFRRESVGFSLDAIVFLARHYLFLSQVYFRGINVGESDKSSGSVIAYYILNKAVPAKKMSSNSAIFKYFQNEEKICTKK